MKKTKKTGLTSEEAAALFLSDGKTTDVNKAAAYDRGHEFDMDLLMRSGLRRAMGFDFKVKLGGSKIYFYSETGPRVSARCKVQDGEMDKYGNVISQDLVDRMVEACMVLKQKWDAKVEKRGERVSVT